MAARFILSLDCEGKWGVADALGANEHRSLSDERLRTAYRSIVELLDEYDIAGTFAFVGAFAQSQAAFARLRPGLEALNSLAPHYLGPALDDISCGSKQGWHGDWAVDSVATARTTHEIALHGVSHIPWNWGDESLAAEDLQLLDQLEGPVRDSRTFVYPRNFVAHTGLLTSAGMLGYRAARRARSRAASLLSEFNIFDRPDAAAANGTPIAIPAGYFVNWRHGLRRAVPVGLSALRARRLLDRAEKSAGVVHYWLHPENIAAEPDSFDLLRAIVGEVARRRDAGRCDVLTQIQYCEQLGLAAAA